MKAAYAPKTQTTPDSPRKRPSALSLAYALVFTAGLTAASAAFAQGKSQPVNASSAGNTDNVIELSPFEVSTSRDNGYYGANTLSGTRLNSAVENLGSSITVITKQQLEDTASVDINDIFRYEANTEGTYDFTATLADNPTSDEIQRSPATATRIRGLSSPNITVDYFTHTSRIPIDTYDVGSAEISRGPNSILAGIGNPSGTFNTTLDEANLMRSTNRIEFRTDSNGGHRMVLNLNRPLWRNKLGIRLAAVNAQTLYPQKPSYDDVRRIYGALKFKPFVGTTIKLNAEVYHQNRQTPNSLTPRDGVSEWIAAGEPTWDPITYTMHLDGTATQYPQSQDKKLPAGLYANASFYTRPPMYIDGGQVQFWEVGRLSTGANPNANIKSNSRLLESGNAYMRGTINGGTLYKNPGVSNKALYDWTSINATPTNWAFDHATSYEAVIEQKIARNLYFRGGWRLEDSMDYNRNVTNPPTLTIDVNERRLDGSANPNLLRPYFAITDTSIYRNTEYNDAVQASLSYQLDLRRHAGLLSWLGNHMIGLNYENRRVTDGTFRYREAIIDPNHVWDVPGKLNYTHGASINRPSLVYYVGPVGALGYTRGYAPPKSGISGTFNLNWYNGATKQWVSDPSQYGTASYITGLTRSEDTARSVSWQGNMLKDHLVVTGGDRKDQYQTRNTATGALIDGDTGWYDYGALKNWGPWSYSDGTTRFISAVVYPFKRHWLGLTYSKASSFQPQNRAVDLMGRVLPNTYGHGEDYGFFVNLFDDKLVLSLKWYKQTITDDRVNTQIGSRVARLEAAMSPYSTSTDKVSLYYWAQQALTAELGTTPTDEQILQVVQYPAGFKSALDQTVAGSSIRGTTNSEGNGAELELSYNPSYAWNLKFNATETIAKTTTIENDLQDYIGSRMAFWQGVHVGSDYWWTSTTYNSQSAQSWYDTNVLLPLKLDQALLGKSNPQLKKYNWRALTTYRFSHGKLKGWALGGSARWADKSVIGYLGAAPDADGIVRSLDVNKPVYDPARYQFDFWTSYSLKLFGGRVAARFQLNLNNAFENGGLRAIGVNPDGQVYNWRIINPRVLVLTSRFDF